jgi:hypothetical protein
LLKERNQWPGRRNDPNELLGMTLVVLAGVGGEFAFNRD